MKTLIFGTSYVGNFARREVVSLWAQLTRRLNPDTDILLIDSASPVDFSAITKENDINVFRFDDNLGHFNITGKDGWGRAFAKGVTYAIEAKYDYVVALDSDLLFVKSVGPIINKMHECGVKVAMPMAYPYAFTETALFFASVPYLHNVNFVAKYDWEHPPPQTKETIPERRVERIFGDDLFCLFLRGYRNHSNSATWQNFEERTFAYGGEWYHGGADIGLYHRFLRMNKIQL